MESNFPLRSFSISGGELSASASVPPGVLRLAQDLFGYALKPNAAGKKTSGAQWLASSYVSEADIPWSDSSTVYVRADSLSELSHARPFEQEVETVLQQTGELLDEWLLEFPHAEYPPSFPAWYGLFRLDRLWAEDQDVTSQLNGVCVAGRCLGMAGFAAGLVEGVRRGGRKAAHGRWQEPNKLRAWVQQRYREGAWKRKSDFIRFIKPEVLERARKIGHPMTSDSADARIREWITDKSAP